MSVGGLGSGASPRRRRKAGRLGLGGRPSFFANLDGLARRLGGAAAPEVKPAPTNAVTNGPVPTFRSEAHREARDLARAFDRLSAEHRQVLLLICCERRTYQEAVATLNVPIAVMVSRLMDARRRLRALLDHREQRAAD